MLKSRLQLWHVPQFISLLKDSDRCWELTRVIARKVKDGKMIFHGLGFLSWDEPVYYSMFITEERIYLQETESAFDPKIIPVGNVHSHKVEEGELSVVMKVSFIRITLNCGELLQFYFVPAQSEVGARLVKVRSDLRNLFGPDHPREFHQVNSAKMAIARLTEPRKPIQDNFIKTATPDEEAVAMDGDLTPGSILLWDFDNVRLNALDRQRSEAMIQVLTEVTRNYGPLLEGYCVHQSAYNDDILELIKKVSSEIETVRSISESDGSDKKLLKKGRKWLELHRPEHIIIISGDYIFTELSELCKEIGTRIILVYYRSNASKDWIGVRVYEGIDLDESINAILRENSKRVKVKRDAPQDSKEPLVTQEAGCSICASVLTSLQGLQAHAKAKHGEGAKLKCPQCSRDVSVKGLDAHVKAVHSPKITCPQCGKKFSSQGLDAHTRAKHKPKVDCPHCSRQVSPQGLDAHIRAKHA